MVELQETVKDLVMLLSQIQWREGKCDWNPAKAMGKEGTGSSIELWRITLCYLP